MENNRNTFLAIALSLAIILAWQFLYINPKLEAERKAAEIQRQQIEQSQPGQQGGANQQEQVTDQPQSGNGANESKGGQAAPGAGPDIQSELPSVATRHWRNRRGSALKMR